MKNSPDLAILNANVITMDDAGHHAEALASASGEIIRVGSDQEIREILSEHTLILNAGGRTVVPGFIDCHAHLMLTATWRFEFELDVFGMGSLKEMLVAIRKEAERLSPGEWISARGFDDTMVVEKRFPDTREIDEAAPNNPVIVKRLCGHACILNTKALEILKPPDETDGLERDPRTEQLSGILRSQANDLATERHASLVSDETRIKSLFETTKAAAEKGITTIHALDGSPNDPRDILLMLKYQDQLPVRVVPYYQSTNVSEILALKLPRIGGCICVDGSMGAHTAAFHEPYTDEATSTGTLYFTDEQLRKFVLEAHRNGLQIAMHAIGDRAVDQLLDAYEAALKAYSREDHRHRIEHIEVPNASQIKRCKQLGIALSVQPGFLYCWSSMRDFWEAKLGAQRAQRIHPYKQFLSDGILLGGGSDSPVTPIDPITGIHAAVNHLVPSHSLSVDEALRLFTIEAAKLAFQENTIGSLQPGKLADIVVLSENPLEVQPARLKDIRVEATIKGGQITYKSPKISVEHIR